MMRFKSILIFFPVTLLLFCCLPPLFGEKSNFAPFGNDERTRKIFKQEQIIKEGSTLVEEGRYEEAIKKYKEALNPSVLNEERDKGNAIYYIEKVYKLQGKYEEALKELQWSINENSNGTGWFDEKLELEALIKARDTNSTQPIYEHIEYLKKKYKDQLPPNAGAYSDIVATAIIRLYDHIGDFDGGIQFVEGFFKRCADGITCKGEERKLAYTPKHPYFPIKQAFLQDKAEGQPSCIDAKPGEVCMGRATKALIQSNYFPW